MKRKLKTLENRIEAEGVGIHSGEAVRIALVPSPDAGISFLRADIDGSAPICLNSSACEAGERRSVITDGNASISTTEHLLAALYALDITDVRVEVSGAELPAGDGSAMFFVGLLKEAGIVDTGRTVREYKPRRPLFVSKGSRSFVLLPAESGLSISYTLDLQGKGIPMQAADVIVDGRTFESLIAQARTFCTADEVPALLEAGFGKGASRENTLVLGDADSAMRMENEAALHKILDIVGDLCAFGAPLAARIVAIGTGHSENHRIRNMLELDRKGAQTGFSGLLDIKRIMKVLPHRYPFLLVDRIIELEPRKRVTGIKNVTMNEEFFQGHFPGEPVMPGVLQAEAMAQTAGIMMMENLGEGGSLAFLMSMNNVKYRKPVVPGDQLVIFAEALRMRSRMGVVRAWIEVEGRVVSEAEISFSIVPRT